MTPQVITIAPDGTLSGLQRKKGQGLDLRQMGHADIERASEITWNEPQQCWHVHVLNPNVVAWMLGACRMGGGATLNFDSWGRATEQHDVPAGVIRIPRVPGKSDDWWLGFEDYDDAVAAEVAFLDALRMKGVF